jgi:SAM-dependent methyltransferase
LLRLFSTFEQVHAFEDALWPARVALETAIAASDHWPIICPVCELSVQSGVNIGAWFGSAPNLREGMGCPHCGLSNRNRLMATLIRDLAPVATFPDAAVFEPHSPFTAALIRAGYQIEHSAFLPSTDAAEHQDMTATTYRAGQFDLAVHNDVLEHIPDFHAALRENHRIVRPGGKLIFTCPIFAIRNTIVRARLLADGQVEHILEPEIHGDPLAADGVLAFYNFGFDLVAAVRDAGFVDAALAVWYDPAFGFTTNNHPVKNVEDGSAVGNMLPAAIVATKAAPRSGWLGSALAGLRR